MRSIFAIAAVFASAGLLLTAVNLARAEDDATRNLSLEQIKVYSAVPAKQASLQVSAGVDRADLTYAKGEVVKLQVKVSEDAHVLVFDTGPTGKIIRLFPNEFQKDDLIKAGHNVSIPPLDSKVRIKVTGDTGAELITVVASNKPIKLVSGTVVSGEDVFLSVKESPEEFAKNLTLESEKPDPAKKLSMVKLVLKTIASR